MLSRFTRVIQKLSRFVAEAPKLKPEPPKVAPKPASKTEPPKFNNKAFLLLGISALTLGGGYYFYNTTQKKPLVKPLSTPLLKPVPSKDLMDSKTKVDEIAAIKQDYWESVKFREPDAIFGMNERFKAEKAPDKMSLVVGAYRDDNGNPYLFPVVTKVEELLLKENANKVLISYRNICQYQDTQNSYLEPKNLYLETMQN